VGASAGFASPRAVRSLREGAVPLVPPPRDEQPRGFDERDSEKRRQQQEQQGEGSSPY
jgi:hypothetical protein